MAIGRISGPMLYNNLDRQGVDISLDGNLIYADVSNRYVGILTSTPAYSLDVPGNVKLANLVILNNSITSNTGKINLGSTSNIQISGGAEYDVLYTDGNGNLAFGNLNSISGLDGFSGNNISLGSNTVGSLSNALTLLESTSVTDAIAQLNELLGNITDSTGTEIHVTTLTVNGTDIYSNVSGLYDNIVILQSNSAYQADWLSTLDSNLGTATENITTLFSNAEIQNTWLSNLESNVTTLFSNAGSQADSITDLYSNAGIQADSITDLYSNAGIQADEISSTNANVAAANIAIATLQTQVYSNANVASYLPIYSGNISAGNIEVTGQVNSTNFYGNIYADVITPYNTAVTIFNSTSAIKLPVGTTGQQPAGSNGMIRYNSELSSLEYYSGSSWVSVTNTVTDQQITPSGTTATFTLNQDANTVGIMVSINGTLQTPYVAYNVHDSNQITFTETPLATDIIDIRFLGASVSVDTASFADLALTGNLVVEGNTSLGTKLVTSSNVTVNTNVAIIDSFDISAYRSAKYVISSTSPYDSQLAEILLLQDNGIAAINATTIKTGSNTVVYTANISGSTVNLLAQGSTNSNQLRIDKTYFII